MANDSKTPEQLSINHFKISQLARPHIPSGKSDIAKVYEISVASLRDVIKRHKKKFDAIGYVKTRNWLTPKERELLREILGDPYLTL